MTFTAATLKLFRQIHLYLGVFISPAILFFSITGALQTFSLHETTRGSDYKPPVWLTKLGQLHKKQTLILPTRRPQPVANSRTPDGLQTPGTPGRSDSPKPSDAQASPSARPSDRGPLPGVNTPKPKNLLPMKIFFLLVSIGLVISTFTGIYMAYKYDRSKPLITGLLLAGVVVPLLLLLF